MPLITLPDGNTIDFPNKVTGLEVAEKISKSLSKQATIISVNAVSYTTLRAHDTSEDRFFRHAL